MSKVVKAEPVSHASSSTTPTKKKSPEPKKIDTKPLAGASKKLEMVKGNGEAQLPWVEKYKPTNLKQVIGKTGAMLLLLYAHD